MLISSKVGVSPEIDRRVTELLDEEKQFNRTERRAVGRESLVRPASVELRPENTEIPGFTKDISPAGVGLLTEGEVKEGQRGKIVINKMRGVPVKIIAEARWCRPFGNGWYLSGWKFIQVSR